MASLLPPPAAAYPGLLPGHPPHARGSFGPVFIVLAVITLLALVACFLSRACARRYSQRQSNAATVSGDLEGGAFEMSFPSPAKPVMTGATREAKTAAGAGAAKSPA
ncbi:unnamed protein product [Spirodela intermedia]|uniref:Uncharacterized protein n=2 Tax=Spirodela intermedia TaxID=51605 RepID=A0A7I8J5Q0_SPIIN|nr:unnamed protein product [Spirodela intermedia]CAA6665558.1 unnamed protein product [Spirodela intermedia]CAA7402293.1 unnamed protein product [Spirodela intermedia]